jgi:murein DD-endopeptidase MepM/ murein hydrolase activator NlpD
MKEDMVTVTFRRTSEFGAMEPFRDHPHTGVDFAMPEGTPVEAVLDGVVRHVVDYGDVNAGKTIILDLENGQTAIYGHLSKFKVKEGETVGEGDVIGLSGNTGDSTGPHLHFGLKEDGQFVDPEIFTPHIQSFDKGIGDIVLEKWNAAGDFIVGKEVELLKSLTHTVLEPIGIALKDGFMGLVNLVNYWSPEIITLGVIFCGGGVIVGAVTGHANKWLARTFAVLWGGIIWRILI